MGDKTRGITFLHGNYVYYRRLEYDGVYPILLNVRNVLGLQLKTLSNLSRIATFFENAAENELKKELALLEKQFGRRIKGSYGLDNNFAHDLIHALNECMGVKKVFERNLALIKESNGQKGVMSWFPDYFVKEWEAVSNQVSDEIVKALNSDTNTPSEQIVSKIVDKHLPKIVAGALERMANAKTETGISKGHRDQYLDAYQEILGSISKLNNQNQNEFIQSFIETYHLNELSQLITKEMAEERRLNDVMAKGKKDSFNIRSQIAQRGGIVMEHFRTFMVNEISNNLANSGSNTGEWRIEAVNTGGTKQKADVTMAVNIPIDVITNWLESNTFGTREKDTAAMVKLQESLSKFNDGFIVYVNSKNYSLNEGFEHGGVYRNGEPQIPGFSAGSKISLANFQAAAQNLDVNYAQLIKTAMQLVPGAIGDDREEEIKRAMCTAIASALFDDFNTIGMVQTSGAQSVHLMDLNGVLTPLSFYFWLLSQAFGEVASLPVSELVSVEIDKPAGILYPDDAKSPPGMAMMRWNQQARDALTNIKIGYHFLAGFKSILNQFNV